MMSKNSEFDYIKAIVHITGSRFTSFADLDSTSHTSTLGGQPYERVKPENIRNQN